MRLIRAAGRLHPGSIDHLLRSWSQVTSPHQLHLDLSDLDIVDAATMRRLEAALDQLECRRIGVRIVGVDPAHPALTH